MANQVVQQAGRVLLGAGLNRTAAAGILGNALQESSWNPGSVGGGGGGLWGFTAHPQSLSDLQGFAASHGANWRNPAVQAHFLLTKLSGSQKQALNSQRSPAAAATWFMSNWERPLVSTENQARRIQGAQQAFHQLGGVGGGGMPMMPGGGATGGRGQRFTSTTVPTFNQAGYQNALGRYQAGVAVQAASKMPPLPNATRGFAASLGNPNRILFQSGALTTTPPNKQGFAGSRTIRTAQNNLQRLAGNTPLAVHPGAVGSGMLNGHYVNPLPGSTFTRTDMGVDGTGKTFRSPADSKILIADAHNAGWKGGGYIAGRILNGPRKGQVWYAAEGLTPNVRVGQTVAAGTRIARPVASPYNGIVGNYEWGWANSSGVSPMAGPNYSEGEIMPAGRDFRRFINRLGAGAGPSHS